MNTRILLIDDDLSELRRLAQELQRAGTDHRQQLGDIEVELLHASEHPPHELKSKVTELSADQRWDAILIDVKLSEEVQQDVPILILPLELLRAFRHTNRIAIAIIYSGSIATHLKGLLEHWKNKDKPIEQNIRVLMGGNVHEFLARDDVVTVTINALLNLPFALQVERELMKTPSMHLEVDALQGLGDGPLLFSQLAANVRKGDRRGHALLQQVSSTGISAVADIYRLENRRQKPWMCITAECDDLRFLQEVVSSLCKDMPLGQAVLLRGPDNDMTQALAAVRSEELWMVIIMLHGGEGYLLGADGSAPDGRERIRWMNQDSHHALLRERIVYCFACNSITLGPSVVAAGARAFIGFPDIPFYRSDSDGNMIADDRFTSTLQKLYSRLTELALFRWFEGETTIEELVDFIRLTARRLLVEYEKVANNEQFRNEIVGRLQLIINEVQFFGDGSCKFGQ